MSPDGQIQLTVLCPQEELSRASPPSPGLPKASHNRALRKLWVIPFPSDTTTPAGLLLHPVMPTQGPPSNSLQTQEGSPPTPAPTFHSFHPHRGLQGTAITPLPSTPCPGLPLHCGVSALEDLPGSKRPCPAPNPGHLCHISGPRHRITGIPTPAACLGHCAPDFQADSPCLRRTAAPVSAGGSLSPRWAAGGRVWGALGPSLPWFLSS